MSSLESVEKISLSHSVKGGQVLNKNHITSIYKKM